MVSLWIIGLSCFSIFCFILSTDPKISGQKRAVATLFFAVPIPIIVVMIGVYLS